MYKVLILLLSFSIIIGSCQKKEIISIERGVVDYRFVGSWKLINGNEKYTFFNKLNLKQINSIIQKDSVGRTISKTEDEYSPTINIAVKLAVDKLNKIFNTICTIFIL